MSFENIVNEIITFIKMVSALPYLEHKNNRIDKNVRKKVAEDKVCIHRYYI